MVDEQTLDGDWLANFITEDDLDEELLEEIEIDEGDKPSVDMDLLTAEITLKLTIILSLLAKFTKMKNHLPCFQHWSKALLICLK